MRVKRSIAQRIELLQERLAQADRKEQMAHLQVELLRTRIEHLNQMEDKRK